MATGLRAVVVVLLDLRLLVAFFLPPCFLCFFGRILLEATSGSEDLVLAPEEDKEVVGAREGEEATGRGGGT